MKELGPPYCQKWTFGHLKPARQCLVPSGTVHWTIGSITFNIYWSFRRWWSLSMRKKRKNHLTLVGTFFIDIANMYCFGTGLPILMSKVIRQYRRYN